MDFINSNKRKIHPKFKLKVGDYVTIINLWDINWDSDMDNYEGMRVQISEIKDYVYSIDDPITNKTIDYQCFDFYEDEDGWEWCSFMTEEAFEYKAKQKLYKFKK